MTSQYYDKATILSNISVSTNTDPNSKQTFTLSNQGVFTQDFKLGETDSQQLIKKENENTIKVDRLFLNAVSPGFLYRWVGPPQTGDFDYKFFAYANYPPNHPYDDTVVLLDDVVFMIKKSPFSLWEVCVTVDGGSTIASGASGNQFAGPSIALYWQFGGEWVPLYAYTRLAYAVEDTNNISIAYKFSVKFAFLAGLTDTQYKIKGTISGAPSIDEGATDESIGTTSLQVYPIIQSPIEP